MSVTFERSDDRSHVGHLRIDFGELNLLTTDRVRDLGETVERIPEDVAVVTLAAADRSGRDTVETNGTATAPGLTGGLDLETAREFSAHDGLAMFDVLYGAIEAVRDLNAVTVCGCGEYTLGAGLELALACDFRVATEGASLGLPEVTVGLPTVIQGGVLLRHVGLGTAKELVYTGEPVTGERAADLGIVTHAVAHGEYEDTFGELVDSLAAKSPLVLQRQKQVFRSWRPASPERGMADSRWLGALSFGTHDQREAMDAFLEDRDPEYEGR